MFLGRTSVPGREADKNRAQGSEAGHHGILACRNQTGVQLSELRHKANNSDLQPNYSEAASVPLPPRGLGPRDGREAGHPGVKWPPSLGKKAQEQPEIRQTQLCLHHHQLISVRLAYYRPTDSRPLTYWARPQGQVTQKGPGVQQQSPSKGSPILYAFEILQGRRKGSPCPGREERDVSSPVRREITAENVQGASWEATWPPPPCHQKVRK